MVDMVEKNMGIDIPEQIRIIVDKAPVHLGDSDDYEAMGTLRENDIYDVAAISAETGWYAVRIPRYVLWVSPECCEMVKSSDEEYYEDETDEEDTEE